ncbi:MAG: cytochrome c553 [Polyangiales bacterium]|jgi:cytochrome c553
MLLADMFIRCTGLLLLTLSLACGDDDSPSDAGGRSDAATADSSAMLDGGPEDVPMDVPQDIPPDVPPDVFDAGPACEGPPGLYRLPRCTELADGVRAYSPNYWLWSDGADKERFISLPEGGLIDTSDPNNWIYPVGTRVWKTFLVGGLRIETRLLEKYEEGAGFDSWNTQTFAWNEEQDFVEEVVGGRENALGTDHDIPSRGMCIQCHGQTGRDDFLTSFTAIQLNHEDAGFSLAELNDEGWLSENISIRDAVIPGTPEESEALGYLHANCGNCHGNRGAPSGLSMWVDVGIDLVDETATYITAVGAPSLRVDGDATVRIVPGDSGQSVAFRRMQSRMVGLQMPPIGTEFVDDDGSLVVQTWIDGLTVTAAED